MVGLAAARSPSGCLHGLVDLIFLCLSLCVFMSECMQGLSAVMVGRNWCSEKLVYSSCAVCSFPIFKVNTVYIGLGRGASVRLHCLKHCDLCPLLSLMIYQKVLMTQDCKLFYCSTHKKGIK